MVALRASKLLIENFGPVIKSFLEAPVGRGVDLQREQRFATLIFEVTDVTIEWRRAVHV